MSAVVFLPGAKVGARRWPLASCHPSIWAKPRRGIVLDLRDPKAWLQAAGAPLSRRDIEQRLVHLEGKYLPVHWCFGDIYWEPVASLLPYETDLSNWTAAKCNAEKALSRPVSNFQQALAA